MNDLTAQNGWMYRVADLSQHAGKTISAAWINSDINTGAGNWDEFFSDIALIRQDGTVIPVYYRQMNVAYPGASSSGVSNQAFSINRSGSSGDAMYATANTTYYLGDHLGSSRMVFSGGGWPVSSSTFYPFGLAQSATTDPNHYKFAGLERDEQNGETGLDHATFRQYSSTQGRWYAPDPYLGSMDLNDPQSFNRYAFVGNNPLGYIDPSGLDKGCVSSTINGVPVGSASCTDWGGGAAGSSGGNVGGFIGVLIDIAKIIGFFHKPAFKGRVGDPRPRQCIANCGKPAPPDDPAPKNFDPSDPSYQLAVALGQRGAYTLISPCSVPAFYATSATIAGVGVGAANAGELVTAASENYPSLINKGVSWLYKNLSRAGWGPGLVAKGVILKSQITQLCQSY